MKKVIKADGRINFVNEKYLDSVLEDTDTVDEDYVVDRTPPIITEEDIAADRQRNIRNTAKKYLADTDWYVTRYAETGTAIPEDIATARAQARIDASTE